jgi:hypothetical protein
MAPSGRFLTGVRPRLEGRLVLFVHHVYPEMQATAK